MLAKGGQRSWIFFKADIRLRKLKALLALTSKLPWCFHVGSSLSMCVQLSHILLFDQQISWTALTASCMSSLITASTALATICLTVSLMPIGRTPGNLLRAMSLLAKNGARPWGSTSVVQSSFVKSDNAWHRSFEANLNAVHSFL